MRPVDDIHRSLKRLQLKASPKLDKRVYDDISNALLEHERTGALKVRPHIWQAAVKFRATRLAVAAVIVLGIGLLAARWSPDESTYTSSTTSIAKSPHHLMTAMSLTMAYRRGGMDAVETQYAEAIDMLGPRPPDFSLKELSRRSDG
ncbi:MAG: hypothetical protein JSU70_06875 [Phycisphaerales bacterium]|nr:MAG: hypothetical protein JSU70_06875 [Phycisphaerales bacterium]